MKKRPAEKEMIAGQVAQCIITFENCHLIAEQLAKHDMKVAIALSEELDAQIFLNHVEEEEKKSISKCVLDKISSLSYSLLKGNKDGI